MTASLPWTHFFVAPDGHVTGFVLDVCETCGGPTGEQAITLVEPPSRLRALGLVQSETLPPEIYYDDDTDTTKCEICPQPKAKAGKCKCETCKNSRSAVRTINARLDSILLTYGDTPKDADVLATVRTLADLRAKHGETLAKHRPNS